MTKPRRNENMETENNLTISNPPLMLMFYLRTPIYLSSGYIYILRNQNLYWNCALRTVPGSALVEIGRAVVGLSSAPPGYTAVLITAAVVLLQKSDQSCWGVFFLSLFFWYEFRETMRLTLDLRTALVLLNACLAGGDSGKITVGLSDSEANLRACTVHELLPLACQSKSSEWTNKYVDEPVYDCSCATMKGRYFCPTQGDAPYLKWEPRAVSKGVCRSKSRAEMVGAPLPPNTKILLYGNSHLRQVVEGIMCMFERDVTAKRVTLGADRVETTVPRDMQCRACYSVENPDEVSPLEHKLLDHGCIAEGDNCRCGDSQGEFMFDNGAVVHFQFSHLEEHKDLADARQNHGMDPLSSYDAVFFNPGNNPSIRPRKAVEMALEVQAAGAQAFWLSSYSGDGRISSWSKGQRDRLFQSGAVYVDIECMARGMRSWTRGEVEGVDDGHFCMPGPSDEIGLLLLKMLWAMFEERM